MPIGMPGWPDLARSTASMASMRMAFAMSWWLTAAAAAAEVTERRASIVLLAERGGRRRESAMIVARRPGRTHHAAAGGAPTRRVASARVDGDRSRRLSYLPRLGDYRSAAAPFDRTGPAMSRLTTALNRLDL